jgi:ATP-dependent Lhr-like helicase
MPSLSIPESLAWAHPVVQEWFVRRFGTPTEPQEQGWPHILSGRATLISAPTGSGKTLSAFLACIDRLVRKAIAGHLEDRTEVLYVSPLKALGNDIQKNLEAPLGEILQLAGERGLLMPEIRTAVRTGDTLAHERRQMLKRPPHILVTTPESLYILLTAEGSRATLRHVETVIVDEIHAIADDKRGAHLALSLERLEALTHGTPVRIGLSATQKPIEEVAHFLTGTGRPAPAIVNIGHRRTLDVAIEVPGIPLGPIATNEMWDEIYERIAELVREHRSTLIFVNTRRLAERVAHNLIERLGEDAVAAHHGSLSRKLRLNAERRLKAGEVQALVATASLELGIDVGTIDLVCHLSSPRSIAVMLQRIGRAGHWRGAIPKGRIFPTTRDELVETSALVHAIRNGELDRLIIPDAPLDILAQQIVATCATTPPSRLFASGAKAQDSMDVLPRPEGRGSHRAPHAAHEDSLRSSMAESHRLPIPPLRDTALDETYRDAWREDEIFDLARRAYPYRNLARADFDAIVEMLSEGIAARRGRYGAYLHRDRVHGVLRARRGARLAAITSGGAIPENALFTVVAEPDGTIIGTLDEDFAVESNKGDIVLLGNTSWRIRRIESAGRVIVEDAHGAPPSVPFWLGEAPARTTELSSEVAGLRRKISEMTPNVSPITLTRHFAGQQSAEVIAAVEWLQQECGLNRSGAEQLIEYIVTGRAVLGAVPTQDCIIAERFFDEGGGMQLVLHAPFGGRINKAWGLSLRKRFCVSFNFELQAAATDNGLNISLAEQHSFPLSDVFQFLHAETVKPVLQQAALLSPIFGTRWRWDANRSLALLRFQGGKKVPPQIQRIRSDDLLASVFPDVAACQENVDGPIQLPDHPLINEVMKDVFHEAMDLTGLEGVLRGIADGSIRCLAVDTPVPSVFSHEILNANPYAYLDDAPLEERRARAVEMRRMLPESVLEEVGKLDPAAIAQVREEAWPDVRDADELADVLHTLIALPAERDPRGTAVPGCVRPIARSTEGAELFESSTNLAHSGLAQPGTPPPQHAKTARAGDPGAVPHDSRPAHWTGYFEMLRGQHRATLATVDGKTFWVAAERSQTFAALYRSAQYEDALPAVEKTQPSFSDALLAALNGWMAHIGPTTASQLSSLLGLPASEINKTLLQIESTGSILRGKFAGNENNELEWCERRLLARIHRLTLGGLRKQIEPVTAAQFMRWLLRWQHVAAGTQIAGNGERGTLEILRQLQGFEIPASAWEREVLSRRMTNYDPQILDQLSLTGAIGWGRLSPHPATLEDSSDGRRRVIPTSVAPITFFVREESDWMLLHHNLRHSESDNGERQAAGLSPGAREVLEFLRTRGASFFTDIVRATGRLKSEVETGLWELVAAGMITADGFDNLRALIDPRRRTGQGRGRTARPRHSAGRWALLYNPVSHAAHEGARAQEQIKAIEATCTMLLERYGVVFRELLVREALAPKWRELLMAFRRLEERGEVRGGRFVSGFIGEQFALPVAVESLRAMRTTPLSEEIITLSAADPLNLVGIIVPGERVPAISGRFVSFKNGVAAEAAPVEPMAHRVTGD